MLNTDLDHKIFMAQSFLETATFHEETLDFVHVDTVNSPLQEKVDIKKRRKIVTHFLYAMVFELSIKIIYEIEQAEEAPHHHNIWCLYKKLSPESKKWIADKYETQVSNMENLIARLNELKDDQGRIWDLNPDMQLLEDALKANEQTVINFKYDGQFNGKSSALGSIMWHNGQLAILPKTTENEICFPKVLLEYAISLKS